MRSAARRPSAAQDRWSAADKGLAFTAAATGTYKLKVLSNQGAGTVTASVHAVGTALHSAPAATLDGVKAAGGFASASIGIDANMSIDTT